MNSSKRDEVPGDPENSYEDSQQATDVYDFDAHMLQGKQQRLYSFLQQLKGVRLLSTGHALSKGMNKRHHTDSGLSAPLSGSTFAWEGCAPKKSSDQKKRKRSSFNDTSRSKQQPKTQTKASSKKKTKQTDSNVFARRATETSINALSSRQQSQQQRRQQHQSKKPLKEAVDSELCFIAQDLGRKRIIADDKCSPSLWIGQDEENDVMMDRPVVPKNLPSSSSSFSSSPSSACLKWEPDIHSAEHGEDFEEDEDEVDEEPTKRTLPACAKGPTQRDIFDDLFLLDFV